MPSDGLSLKFALVHDVMALILRHLFGVYTCAQPFCGHEKFETHYGDRCIKPALKI